MPRSVPPEGPASPSVLPFYAAAIILALAAAAVIGWLFTEPARGLGSPTQAALVATGAVLLLAAAWTFVWPARLGLLTAPLRDLPAAFMDAREQLADIQAIRKEYYKVRTDIEGFVGLVKSSQDATDDILRQTVELIRERQEALEQTALQRKRLEEELMGLRQSVGDAKREGEEWQKAALRFAAVIERTIDAESGLSEGYLQAADKFAKDFDRTFQTLGLTLIRPSIGDPFDPASHEAAGELETNAARPGEVAACESWGHMTRAGGVVAKARVRVAKAPAPAPDDRDHDGPLCGAPDTAMDRPPATPPSTIERPRFNAGPVPGSFPNPRHPH